MPTIERPAGITRRHLIALIGAAALLLALPRPAAADAAGMSA